MRLLVITLIFVSFYSSAQKIDLDRFYVPLKYISLPENNALMDSRTYTVLLYSDPGTLAQLGLRDSDLESALSLNGYVYNASREVDVVEELSIGNIRILSQEIQTYQVQNKNSQGAVISTTNVFYVASKIIVPTQVRLSDKRSSKELENIMFADIKNPIVYRSKDFYSNNDAVQFMKGGMEADRSAFVSKAYKDKLYAIFNIIHKKYCYEFKDYKELFWEIDLRKSPEYKEFNEKLDLLKRAFSTMSYSSPLDGLKEELAPVLEFWSNGARQINPEDKKTRKLKYAYLINLARAQFWLEMPEECAQTCQEIIVNDYDEGDGKSLLLLVNDYKKSIELNNVNSRHFERAGFHSNKRFTVAGNILFEQTKERAPAGFNILPGYVIDSYGQQLDGELWVKNIDHYECFLPAYGTVFVYNTPNGQQKMTITPDNIKMLSVGESLNFMSLVFYNTVGLPQKKQIFRILHENKKVSILKTYTTSSGSNILNLDKASFKEMWANTDLCLMMKSTLNIQPINSLSTQKIKENVIAFYSDCVDLKTKLLNDEIKNLNTLNGQIMAADIFAANCQ